VGLHVGAQVGTVGERFAAVSATVRLLAGVRPQVALQQPRPAEHLSAHAARVCELVRELVHGQRGHAHVRFAAHVAPFSRLRIQAPVRLFVSGQIRRRGVPLAALGARVLGRAAGRRPCKVGADHCCCADGRLVVGRALFAGRGRGRRAGRRGRRRCGGRRRLAFRSAVADEKRFVRVSHRFAGGRRHGGHRRQRYGRRRRAQLLQLLFGRLLFDGDRCDLLRCWWRRGRRLWNRNGRWRRRQRRSLLQLLSRRRRWSADDHWRRCAQVEYGLRGADVLLGPRPLYRLVVVQRIWPVNVLLLGRQRQGHARAGVRPWPLVLKHCEHRRRSGRRRRRRRLLVVVVFACGRHGGDHRLCVGGRLVFALNGSRIFCKQKDRRFITHEIKLYGGRRTVTKYRRI